MSGTNPFRRKTTASQIYNTPLGEADGASPKGAEAHLTSIDTDIPRPIKTKTGKTVRIISPHSAASDFEDDIPNHGAHRLPLRPNSPPVQPVSPESPTNEMPEPMFSAIFDSQSAKSTTDRISSNSRSKMGVPSPSSEVSISPANPFNKTWASLEGTGTSGEGALQSEASSSTKPRYDVDGFKELLLTGRKLPEATTTAKVPLLGTLTRVNVDDSSSSADASPTFRDSLIGSASIPIDEPSQTSQEERILYDGIQSLPGAPAPRSQKVKPVTPRHRYGKLVHPKTPQIVSFEDPSLSFAIAEKTPVVTSGQSVKSSPGTTGDGQKPLPSQPTSPLSPPAKESSSSALAANAMYFDSSESQESAASRKKTPPVPPLSRRHSQLRPKSFVMSSDRSSPISEEITTDPAAHVQARPLGNSKPAPPPPRRSGMMRQDSSSSVRTTASMAASSDQSLAPMQAPASTPPGFSPSLPAAKRPTQTSPLSGSPSMAPTPPPRRRGSSQSSYTQTRLNGDYRSTAEQRLRSDSGASSISQLQMTPVESNSQKKDVLADLSVLQREVDELRGKFGK